MKIRIALVVAVLLLIAGLRWTLSSTPKDRPTARREVSPPSPQAPLDLPPSAEPRPVSALQSGVLEAPRERSFAPKYEKPLDPVEARRIAAARKLKGMKIDAHLKSVKLRDAIDFLRQFSGLIIASEAGLEKAVDLDQTLDLYVRESALEDVLARLLGPAGLDYSVIDGDVVLRPAKPVRKEGLDAVLAATRVDLEAVNTPISAVVEELRERSGLDLRYVDSPGIMVVSFKASQESLSTLLPRLLEARGYRARAEGATLWIEPRSP